MKRLQNRIRDLLASLKLATKLTLLILLFVLLPTLCITALHFSSARAALIDKETDLLRADLYNSLDHTDQGMAFCHAAARAVLDDKMLFRTLEAYRSPAILSGEQRTESKEAAVAIGRVSQASPGLHAVRLYLDGQFREHVPVLCRLDRMKEQPWYTSPLPSNNTWKFGYADQAFSAGDLPAVPLAVLLNEARSAHGDFIGVLEVSMPMQTLFRDIYELEEREWAGFVDATGTLHHDRPHAARVWNEVIGSVVYGVISGGREYTATVLSQGSHTVLAASVPVPELGGRLIRAVLLDEELRTINQRRFLAFAGVLLFNMLCVVMVHWAVRKTLDRVYRLTDISVEVQRGNLSVEVPDMGCDEVGVLSANFREAILRMQRLLKTSVERETLVKTTEIRALQNQINSHFIYNVLEAIKMMAEIDEKYEISDAVTSLGKLLRYSMRWASSMVHLQEELDYIHHYIALLNLRYDYTITLSVNVPPELLTQEIPKMSLQPIVENAVYHGIEGLEEDAIIRINAVAHGDYYNVEITDSGKGMDPDSLASLRRQVYGEVKETPKHGGIGLRNVQNRIRLCYGNGYGLEFYTQENCYMKVVVKLPLARKENTDGKASHCGR